VGTIAEIPILFYVGSFIKRFGAYTVVIFAFAMTGLRFLFFAVAPNAEIVRFVQLLNGFNYPLLNVAGVTYADEQAPPGLRATAQGLFNVATGGIGAAIGGFLGGPLIESIGASGMYLIFSMFIVFVVILVSLVRRILPPEVAREPLPNLV
jgi:PPP family 3-phenylpropionic acid transporter